MHFIGTIDGHRKIFLTEDNKILLDTTFEEVDTRSLLIFEKTNRLQWADQRLREDILHLITPTEEIFDLVYTSETTFDLTQKIENELLEGHIQTDPENEIDPIEAEKQSRETVYGATILFTIVILSLLYFYYAV